MEESITELTVSTWVLRKENKTLKNNLCLQKEIEEWKVKH